MDAVGPQTRGVQSRDPRVSLLTLVRHAEAIVSGLAPPRGTVTIGQILRATADFYDVGVQEIVSVRRTSRVVRPRQVAMYLARTLANQSLPKIARYMGGRHHTTVLHAVRQITALLSEEDGRLRSEIGTIRHRLRPLDA